MKKLPNPYGAGECFFCGPNNPIGLKLTFYETETEPKELVCRWTPARVFKGLGKVLHGGIQSGLFDEIMGWTALHRTNEIGVTSNIEVRFLKPLFVDQEIEVIVVSLLEMGPKSTSRRKSRIAPEMSVQKPPGPMC